MKPLTAIFNKSIEMRSGQTGRQPPRQVVSQRVIIKNIGDSVSVCVATAVKMLTDVFMDAWEKNLISKNIAGEFFIGFPFQKWHLKTFSNVCSGKLKQSKTDINM